MTQPTAQLNSSNFNKEQWQAINHVNGPMLVLAGAGTGKTKVLTSRIANLIFTKNALPHEILAVTFTNKAANVMKGRIENLLGEEIPNMYIGTFHSLSARILRKHAHLLGINNNFTIIDQDDQTRLIKRIMTELGYNQEKLNFKAIINQISAWKDKVIKPEQISTNHKNEELIEICKTIYPLYQTELLRANSCDFGDLILHVITLLSQNEELQHYYNNKFKYILVDEYQDTNTSQYLWLRLIASGRNNICCVGDDDQSIYAFRGAEVQNILRFEKDFTGAKIIKLQQNYRSTQHILNVASHLISNNQKRHQKKLFTADTKGEKVKIISNWDDKSEANTITDEINHLLSNGKQASEIAILVRAFFQTRNFEESLLNKAIPYKIIGGLKFYDRKEIKDIIAYLRIIHSTSDNLALERIINTPKRGIGPATLQKANEVSRTDNISLYSAFCHYKDSTKNKIKDELTGFINLITEARTLKTQISLQDLAKYIITHIKYEEMLKESKDLNYKTKLENIQEFYTALNEFENLEEFLEHVGLVNQSQNTEDKNFINIITLHSAKGLEFQTVFLTGWEDGLFPHQRTIEEEGNKGIEEERRLAYVGITRAKKELYISYATNRRMFNKWQSNIPSRFLKEIPEEDITYYNHGGTSFHSNSKKSINNNKKYIPKFQINNQINHNKFGQGTIKSIIGDVIEVVFDSGETRFITASTATIINTKLAG